MLFPSHYLTQQSYAVQPATLAPDAANYQDPEPLDIKLEIRQHPREGLVVAPNKEKARKPIDPPPIVQLEVSEKGDPQRYFLQSPYMFMSVNLIDSETHENIPKGLTGSSFSSLHRLKDSENKGKDGAFFIFGDLSGTQVGTFCLQFTLWDYRQREGCREVVCLAKINSSPFNIVNPKNFKGLAESSFLSRAFADQGVRIRLRKEPRSFQNGGTNSKKRDHDHYQADAGVVATQTTSAPAPPINHYAGLTSAPPPPPLPTTHYTTAGPSSASTTTTSQHYGTDGGGQQTLQAQSIAFLDNPAPTPYGDANYGRSSGDVTWSDYYPNY